MTSPAGSMRGESLDGVPGLRIDWAQGSAWLRNIKQRSALMGFVRRPVIFSSQSSAGAFVWLLKK